MRASLRTLASLALGLIVLCVNADNQQPLKRPSSASRSPFTTDFARIVELAMQEWHVAGLAISVVDGNDTFAEGFGFATLPDVQATPGTLWYVGSTTKAHTTATLAALIDSRNYSGLALGWKTPISSIIRDDFVLHDAWATEHLTLEDAAAHRTGMTRHDQSMIWEKDHPRRIVIDTVRNLRNLPMHIEPRTEFHYCNLFYTVLTHIAETVTGRWLGDLAKDIIWAPLGMNSTYFDLEDAMAGPEHLSQGYIWSATKEELIPLPFVATSAMNGAGAVISNVIDYAKWMRSLLNREDPLSEAVHKEIRTARMIANIPTIGADDPTLYSLAWFQATIYGKRVVWHSGSTMTHGALVYWFPDDNYGITIFANSVTPLRQILMYKLIEDRFRVSDDRRIDVDSRMREAEKAEQQLVANASNLWYPDRPSTPLPPTLNLDDHAGTYEDAGYGSVSFYVGTHLSRPEEKTLVADRMDRAWNESVRLEHVSGDYWIWFTYLPGVPDEIGWFSKAEFRVGSDGAIAALEVEIYDYEEDVSQGRVSYTKVT